MIKKILFLTSFVFSLSIPIFAGWEIQPTGLDANIIDICFADSLHGWAISDSQIIGTIDGGKTWQQHDNPVQGARFSRLFCLDKATSFIIGSKGKGAIIYRNGVLLKTENSGDKWSIINSPECAALEPTDIFFIDNNIGWMTGLPTNDPLSGAILQTADGGNTWHLLWETTNQEKPYRFGTIAFADANMGWTVGIISEDPMGPEDLLQTFDGGKTWSKIREVYSGGTRLFAISSKILLFYQPTMDFSYDGGKIIHPILYNGAAILSRDIAVYEDKIFYILARQAPGQQDYVLITSDYGENVRQIYHNPGNAELLAIACAGDRVWAAGYKGVVMKYTKDPAFVKNKPIPQHFELEPNYPNPFSAHTHFSFSLAQPEVIKISVFDLRGRLVRTLDVGSLAPGKHAVVWDGKNHSGQPLAAGIYFYWSENSAGLRSKLKKLTIIH